MTTVDSKTQSTLTLPPSHERKKYSPSSTTTNIPLPPQPESSCRRPFLFERKPGMKNTFDKSESWNQQRYAYGINDELITWKSSWIRNENDVSKEDSDQTIGKRMTLTFSTVTNDNNSYEDYSSTYGSSALGGKFSQGGDSHLDNGKKNETYNKNKNPNKAKKNYEWRYDTQIGCMIIAPVIETRDNDHSAMMPGGQRNVRKLSHHGNHPDTSWRAIPMHHLRRHPHYTPLPHSFSITSLPSLRSISLFRQDSWQWSALQAGRFAPSICPFVLGLLEPIVGLKVLKLNKRSIRGRSIGKSEAFRRLRAPSSSVIWDDEDLDDLCLQNRQTTNESYVMDDGSSSSDDDHDVWVTFTHPRSSNRHHARRYSPRLPPAKERLFLNDIRRDCMAASSHGTGWGNDIRSIETQWERAQKPTALLTALNYFHRLDPRITIQESGMHVASLHDEDERCLLGASPDGIIRHPDGFIEALEVKTTCPFYQSSNDKSHLFYTCHHQDVMDKDTIPLLNIPGMMLQMHCLGPDCRSAVMVRQSATKGAVIFRLHRDDLFIADMIYFLSKFKEDFIDRDITKIPVNFFYEAEDDVLTQRYRRFVKGLKTVQMECVDVLACIPHKKIQRVLMPLGEKGMIPLFLD